MLRFLADLYASARRPAVLKHCSMIALVVGTILTSINLGDAYLAGAVDSRVVLKTCLNYVVPFVVSNLGALSASSGDLK